VRFIGASTLRHDAFVRGSSAAPASEKMRVDGPPDNLGGESLARTALATLASWLRN